MPNLRERARHVASLPLLAALVGTAALAGDAPEILVSRQLAQAAGLEVGAQVRLATVPGGAGARDYRVAGVYEPVPNPFILAEQRHEVRMHLPDLVELRNPAGDPHLRESVSRVNVALRDPSAVDAFQTELTRRIPGLRVARARQDGSDGDPFVVLERFHWAIAVITVIGSSAFLLALMVMRSEERRETAGILRLIGLSRPRILLEGFFEGLCIAIAGAVFGIVLALAAQGAFNRFFQWYYDTALVFVSIEPGTVARCLLVAIPLGILAGLFASWTLLRREILALLRR
jgi:putative ABC transport system permease protein